MDKGKKPIEDKEEDFLSLDEDDYDPNVILSPTTLAPPDFSILCEGLGSGKETTLVDEMEAAKEDFFTKFLNMNFADQPSANMNELYSRSPTSKAPNFPIAEADNKSPVLTVRPKINTLPPRAPRPLPPLPAPDANYKPVVFRKTMPPHELAEVAIYDPKRAKRIMTNRLSAIRAKEKKKLYMCMLEHRLHSLQSKSAILSARLILLLSESNYLNSENNILKDRMEIMTKQLHLQDSMTDQIRSEIQHMRNVLAQIAPNYETITRFSGNYNPARNAPVDTASHQLEQLQLQNPYRHQVQRDRQHQQMQVNLQQHPYLGLRNFGGEYERGECSQHQQQLQQQQNEQPHGRYQVQNEEEQLPEFELTHTEDYNVDHSRFSPNKEHK